MDHCGIVEGFYWRKEHSVGGRYGQFDPQKRLRLLEFMGRKGLNIYVYEPKVLREETPERAYDPARIGDARQWADTFAMASEQGIDFVWGLGPGRYRDWRDRTNGLCSVIELILSLGAAGFTLFFDDVEGSQTDSEMKHQADLANMLHDRYPGKNYGLCSGSYCGTKIELEGKLATLDRNLGSGIRLVFTGREVWPESVTRSDLPEFASARKCILWDNWMASDTSDPARLKLAPPHRREKDLWSEIGAYWLNPNFPVERVVHMVSAVGEMMRNGGSLAPEAESRLIETMARDWAEFLEVEEEPILRMMLWRTGYGAVAPEERDVESIVRKWPSLEPILVGIVK